MVSMVFNFFPFFTKKLVNCANSDLPHNLLSDLTWLSLVGVGEVWFEKKNLKLELRNPNRSFSILYTSLS